MVEGENDATPGPGLVAVVTGASRGLGAGLARAFAHQGLRLGLCARHLPVAPSGADAVCGSVDVTDAAALDGFAGEVVARFGRIDLWVNNAGVLDPTGPLADADPEALRRHVEVNVTGALFGCRTFARHVRTRPGGGVLVNISSGAGTKIYEGWAAYCASKAAVDMMTAVVGAEEHAHGLRGFALAPGVVDTDMQATIRATPAARFPSVGRFVQLHRDRAFNSPDRVATFILDLVAGRREATDGVRVRVPDQPGHR
ncbi:MAG TPA: SDR family NAD(P)-dependent oxidoreductase [Acidimicrobiales bacterium]|nr:SDR family NAD(P)-dependent oxidoreductase [Acidimicrobiales bacterium]